MARAKSRVGASGSVNGTRAAPSIVGEAASTFLSIGSVRRKVTAMTNCFAPPAATALA